MSNASYSKRFPVKSAKEKDLLTVEVVAAAIKAYRTNDSRIEPIPITNAALTKLKANTDLIRDSILNSERLDLVEAQEMIDFLTQRFMIKVLSNDISHFHRALYEAISRTETPHKNISIISYAPKVADNLRALDEKQNTLEQHVGSQFLSSIGSKIELTFTPIEIKYIAEHFFTVILGHDGSENLVNFGLSPSGDKGALIKTLKVGVPQKISGKVKSHTQNKYTRNINCTVLNYVRLA